MDGIRIDGKGIAQSIKDEVRSQVIKLKEHDVHPCLATILVGDDVASTTYVRNKHKACVDVGIEAKIHKLLATTPQSELNKLINQLNLDNSIHGVLVQLPLPQHLSDFEAIMKISPNKDVDGLTPYNAGLLVMGMPDLVACTPLGVIEILQHYQIDMEGKNVVIINRSNLVGKPLYHLLLQHNATITTCHSKTQDMASMCKKADIIITAVGNRDRFVLTSDMVKEGAIVIDVAISRFEGKLVGDADYPNLIKKVSLITPVPGGVGPMTVAMLLKNTVRAASRGVLDE